MARKPRQAKTLLQKVDELDAAFAPEVAGLSVQALEKRIVDMQKGLEDSENHKNEKQGEAIKKLKEDLKTINAPYNDFKKGVLLKTKYVISLIREKGGQ